MKTQRAKFCCLIVLSVLLSSCASIHVGNFSSHEHFRQRFDYKKMNEDISVVGDMLQLIHDSRTKNKSDKLDAILFKSFLNSDDGKETLKAFQEDEVVTDGILNLVLYLIPSRKLKSFQISGGGHYDIYNEKTMQVYFSTTFRITGCKNCTDIDRLFQANNPIDTLIVTFTQVAINQFNYPNPPRIIIEDKLPPTDSLDSNQDVNKCGDCYIKSSKIAEVGRKYKHSPTEDFEVRIKVEKYGKKRIAIDYEADHPVYFKNLQIGELTFTPPPVPNSKIIDLRGLNTLLRKYPNFPPKP